MSDYATGHAILVDVLNRADELGIGLSEREDAAKRYIQAAYVAVVDDGFPWWWAKKDPPGVLQTFDAVEAGSATTTNGSTTVTVTPGPVASMAGWRFLMDPTGIVYRVVTHVAGNTTLTLDAPYLGPSESGAFHLFLDEYSLPADFLRPLQKVFLRDMHGNCHVELRNEDEVGYRQSYPGLFGQPEECYFIAPRRIRLAPAPLTGRRYEVHYLQHPTQALAGGILPFDDSDADALLIQPPEDRIVVAFFAIGNLLVDKGDDRAATHIGAATAKLEAMKRLGHKHMHARRWVRRANNVAGYR